MIIYPFSFFVFYLVFSRLYNFKRDKNGDWVVCEKIKFPLYVWLLGIIVTLTPYLNGTVAGVICGLNIVNRLQTAKWKKTLTTFKLHDCLRFLTKKY